MKVESQILKGDARSLCFISWGVGVQSTTLLVMSALGLKEVPRADIAIFADTQDEPRWVYEETLPFYREWAEKHGVDVLVTTNGRLSWDLRDGVATGKRFASIPAFTEGAERKEGKLRRQCTREYKIDLIQQGVRLLMGYGRRKHVRHAVTAMLGISTDEAHRMKPSRVKWIANTYPLIDARMNRQDCKDLLASLGLPVPKKSSCVFCPYHSDAFYRMLKENDPRGFESACDVDATIRNASKRGDRQQLFVHRSLLPLSEVNFEQQPELFGNECEGYCGV